MDTDGTMGRLYVGIYIYKKFPKIYNIIPVC